MGQKVQSFWLASRLAWLPISELINNLCAKPGIHPRAPQSTLIISVSDHETGGLTVGRTVNNTGIYSKDHPYSWNPEVRRGGLLRVFQTGWACVCLCAR